MTYLLLPIIYSLRLKHILNYAFAAKAHRLQALRTVIIDDSCQSENINSRFVNRKRIVENYVDEFCGTEGVCFPLRTRYSTSAVIAECADRVLKCEHIDELKVAEDVKNKRLADLFESSGSSKSDRQKIGKELNFSDNLLEELITHPLIYIDRDDIVVRCQDICVVLQHFSDSHWRILR